MVRSLVNLPGLPMLACSGAFAQSSPTPEPPVLEKVVVTGRAVNLVGVADTATQGTVGAKQLKQRPILRPGELLETVPGVVISQHSGAGKANQYYLRGFNLDHGTDFATTVDGVPINLPTHAHGQGYTDLNFLIPELVKGIRYEKGAYNAESGDFSAAGAARMDLFETLPEGIAHTTAGSFKYGRLVVADSPKVGAGSFLYGLELYHNDGPWVRPDDYRKANGVLRYSGGTGASRYHITGMAYSGDWNATDQIPQRAVDEGLISRFDSFDHTTGGVTHRYSLSGDARKEDSRGSTAVNAYLLAYRLNLFSNFTYFLDDPVNGDQFEQADKRFTGGGAVTRQWNTRWKGLDSENEIGLQTRTGNIGNVGLYSTKARQVLSTTRQDHVVQTSGAAFYQNRTAWTPKFRTVAGILADAYHFDVRSSNPLNSGTKNASIASPKLSLIFGPFKQSEFYASAGYGFHSNDARGTTITVNPKTGLPVDPDTGEPVRPVTPLVRAKEAEIGVWTARMKGLQSTLSLWYLHLASELLFTGDAGTTETSRPTRRSGIEFTNYYTPTPNWTVDADFSTSRARFTDYDPVGQHVPGALETVVAAGAAYDSPRGVFGSLRLRYFGPRPLIEDNSIRSKATTLLYARLGYTVSRNNKVSLDVFNLLNTKASDIDYYYTSRLPGEPSAGVNDVHFHPAESRSVRVTLSTTF